MPVDYIGGTGGASDGWRKAVEEVVVDDLGLVNPSAPVSDTRISCTCEVLKDSDKESRAQEEGLDMRREGIHTVVHPRGARPMVSLTRYLSRGRGVIC